jgi:hypothetical protein
MNMRSVLIGIVSASMNISACSGLVFAVALMSPVSGNIAEANMSPAPPEQGCFGMSFASEVTETKTNTGCQDTASCLENTVRTDMQRLITASNTEFSIDVPLFYLENIYTREIQTIPLLHARDGPLYEMPKLLAMQIFKRE